MPEFLVDFLHNFKDNLFKPLVLFFYMGFSVPFLRIAFEFPYVIYQGLTIYLLISIGWHGGEELAELYLHKPEQLAEAGGFMLIGFITNFFIGILAYTVLRKATNLRRIDSATVAAYYGSDSAGTFVTCVGVLTAAKISYAAYMPVLLAVMEIPGCLVGLYLVSRLRNTGMDRLGNMPDEPGYDPKAQPMLPDIGDSHGGGSHGGGQAATPHTKIAVENSETAPAHAKQSIFSPQMLHEIFLNPGLFLLFAGIIIGLISKLNVKQAEIDKDDLLFVTLLHPLLCLFLLEMGMTAAKRIKDLKTAGLPFILCALIGPNVFATIGITVAHVYSHMLGQPFELGTYALFAVLCGAASYIAVPAIQRIAIPEASPTLPLAASLGLTFSYNVTIGIPVYLEIAKAMLRNFPVHVAA